MNEVHRLIESIKRKFQEYFKESGYTEEEFAKIFGVSVRLVKSWLSGSRVFRLIHWKAFIEEFKEDPKDLYSDLVQYREYLTSKFNEYYVKHLNLFRKFLNEKFYPYYDQDKEDIMQRACLTLWERMDDLDNRECLNFGTFIGYVFKQVFNDVHVSYTRNKRLSPTETLSLDYEIPNSHRSEGFTLMDKMIDDNVTDYNLTNDRLLVESLLENLSDREREVLECRFYYGDTLESVGERFGITKERVRQIEERALNKIKEELQK